MPEILDPARHLALRLGWPVLLIKPMSKEPYTAHGVKDATVDERTILHWIERYPNANLAVACGAPGPTVLDIDEPEKAKGVLTLVDPLSPPVSVTYRGSQMFFAGTTSGTISLPYGELRGRGSYVVVPPSIHPSGKAYEWLREPRKVLPQVPDAIIGERRSAGAGEFEVPDLIPKGKRHEALKELALRLVRSGVTDVPTIVTALKAFYEERCTKTPPARANEFTDIAKWVTSTDIARRERLTEENTPTLAKKAKKATKKLGKAPDGDAPLAEHRDYVKVAAGLPGPVNVATIARAGVRQADSLTITLSNGQRIVFPRQDQITRTAWPRIVVMCTSGIADPPKLSEEEMLRVYRSMCIVADPPPERTEEDDVRDALSDYAKAADVIYHQDLSTWHGRYEAIVLCRARPEYDPRHPDREPVVLVDLQGQRYIRAGEVRKWLAASGLGMAQAAVHGRLSMIGAEYMAIDGREDRTSPQASRRTNRMLVYRLPEEL